MLLLNSKSLTARAITHLANVQHFIGGATLFVDKVTAAQNAWINRTSNAAFDEIKEALNSMCVGIGICNYCENNESTDIEHIYPKSFFPELAFVWENYLLACKTCNSHYKLDKIAVFNPLGSTNRFDVPRGSEPPSKDVLLINPRIEDPLSLLSLNLRTGIFLANYPPNTREYQKANYTLEVLSLNNRDALREAREAKVKEIFRKLEYATRVAEASSFPELDAIINANEPFIALDTARPFEEVKNKMIQNIRNAIVTAPHPTVWEEIKRQHLVFERFSSLFARLPEAVTW